ncbi:MAG TPA: hypothetical protein VFQ25_06040 [Ktedonobacterales bacterium]|nr:hypothetical protein [Ktedonobacterales bacterium]
MARRMVARAGETWRGPRGGRLRAAGLIVALGLALVACSSGDTSSAATPTATTAGQATATLSVSGTPSPSPTPLPGGAAQAGVQDICSPSSPLPVTTSVPAEIPAYANGRLQLATQIGSDSAEFGYCTSDTVSAVATFYTQGLSGKGWQNIQTFDNLSTVNIIGTRGDSENVTITIAPDAKLAGNTDLLIIVKGL